MELDGTSLLVSFVVSSIGFVAFSYGRKMGRPPPMLVGLALMVFPYFVPNLWLVGGITVGLLAAMWGAIRLGW